MKKYVKKNVCFKDSWTRHYMELSCFEVRDFDYIVHEKEPRKPSAERFILGSTAGVDAL
jgi:hypothetical protein